MNYTVLSAGQARPYADDVSHYSISNATREEIISTFHLNPTRELPGATHNGTCGFPFGLYSFWTLTPSTSGSWDLQITVPYCD